RTGCAWGIWNPLYRVMRGLGRFPLRLASRVPLSAGAVLHAEHWSIRHRRRRGVDRAVGLRVALAAPAAGALARGSDAAMGTGDDALAALARLREELSRRDRSDARGARA